MKNNKNKTSNTILNSEFPISNFKGDFKQFSKWKSFIYANDFKNV